MSDIGLFRPRQRRGIPLPLLFAFIVSFFIVFAISLPSAMSSFVGFYGFSMSDIFLVSFGSRLDYLGSTMISYMGVFFPLVTLLFPIYIIYRCVRYSFVGFSVVPLFLISLNSLIVLYFPLFMYEQDFSYLGGDYYSAIYLMLSTLFGTSGIIIVTLMPFSLILIFLTDVYFKKVTKESLNEV